MNEAFKLAPSIPSFCPHQFVPMPQVGNMHGGCMLHTWGSGCISHMWPCMPHACCDPHGHIACLVVSYHMCRTCCVHVVCVPCACYGPLSPPSNTPTAPHSTPRPHSTPGSHQAAFQATRQPGSTTGSSAARPHGSSHQAAFQAAATLPLA